MLIGGGGNDNLVGQYGDDELWGGDGDNSLTGGTENDILAGGGGADAMDGGLGADQFVYLAAGNSTDAARDSLLWFQSGLDKIDLTALGAAAIGWVPLAGGYNLVTVQLGAAAMKFYVQGAVAGADFLLSSSLVIGTPGNDTLRGFSAGSVERMEGGAGNDLYYVDNAGDLVVEAAGAGADAVYASVSYTLAGGQHVETAVDGQSWRHDRDQPHRQRARPDLIGNAGANVLDGGGGADTCSASAATTPIG